MSEQDDKARAKARADALKALTAAGRKVKAANEAVEKANDLARETAVAAGEIGTVSVIEMAQRLNVSRQTVYNWTGIGRRDSKINVVGGTGLSNTG
jgi:DNA invertase Pin-like site-specific DNA recombinase